jgi:hypothetical protein
MYILTASVGLDLDRVYRGYLSVKYKEVPSRSTSSAHPWTCLLAESLFAGRYSCQEANPKSRFGYNRGSRLPSSPPYLLLVLH